MLLHPLHPSSIFAVTGTLTCPFFTHKFCGGAENTEINVYLVGTHSDASLKKLLDFIDGQWHFASEHQPLSWEAWLDDYEKRYIKAKQRAKSHPKPPSVVQRKRGKRNRRPTSLSLNKRDLNLDWDEYYEKVTKDSNHPIFRENGNDSYLLEVKRCQDAFRANPGFTDQMPVDDRKTLAGYGERSTGFLGHMWQVSMSGLGRVVEENPQKIGRHIDKIPLRGRVDLEKDVRPYLDGMMEIKGIAMGFATRLLCVKRPDLFLSANGGVKDEINRYFGKKSFSVDNYIEIVETIWSFRWFEVSKPAGDREREVWRARVALLDAILWKG